MQERINEIMNEALKSGSIKSASCRVLHKGNTVYSGSFGLASQTEKTPMSTSTICRLFSLTKPVTAAAAMIAMDKGLFAPDTELSRFFTEYSRMKYSTDSR